MQGDPRWITNNRPGQCAGCRRSIAKKERVFFYPNGQRMYCNADACGISANRDFEAHRQDEDGF
jgi:hypothetical protein